MTDNELRFPRLARLAPEQQGELRERWRDAVEASKARGGRPLTFADFVPLDRDTLADIAQARTRQEAEQHAQAMETAARRYLADRVSVIHAGSFGVYEVDPPTIYTWPDGQFMIR